MIMDFYQNNSNKEISIQKLMGDQAFIIDNLLSEEQCNILINRFEENQAKDHVKNDGYDINYRNNIRLIFDDTVLAKYLFDIVSPYLSQMQITSESKEVSVDSYSYGLWNPTSINERFRLCKYDTSGHFSPHYDGFYEKDVNNRTYKTIMLYLNEGFDGGCTKFLEKIDPLIKPKVGRAIVFDHHIFHEGEIVKSNQKYILRSDIMYTRDPHGSVTNDMVKHYELKKKAIEYEELKDYDNAIKMYRQISKISP